MYVLFSGSPAIHAAAVVLGPYRLLAVPTGDIWSPELHKFNEVLRS